jgi:hypothetical protein
MLRVPIQDHRPELAVDVAEEADTTPATFVILRGRGTCNVVGGETRMSEKVKGGRASVQETDPEQRFLPDQLIGFYSKIDRPMKKRAIIFMP